MTEKNHWFKKRKLFICRYYNVVYKFDFIYEYFVFFNTEEKMGQKCYAYFVLFIKVPHFQNCNIYSTTNIRKCILKWLFDWITTKNRTKKGRITHGYRFYVLCAKFELVCRHQTHCKVFIEYTNKNLKVSYPLSVFILNIYFYQKPIVFSFSYRLVLRAYTTDQKQWQEYRVFRSWSYKPISDYCLGAWVIF